MLSVLLLTTIISKGQTGYFFAYGVNTDEKTIYISSLEDISKYTECEDEHGYHTKLTPKECLLNSFRTSLKIEVGSSYYKYDLTPVTKRNSSGYGTDEYFSSRDEAEKKRKEVMANYIERNYTIGKLNL